MLNLRSFGQKANPVKFFRSWISCSTSHGPSIYDLKNRGNQPTLGAKGPGRKLFWNNFSFCSLWINIGINSCIF